jgi:Fe-S cluster assembly iron-binding protein IscA
MLTVTRKAAALLKAAKAAQGATNDTAIRIRRGTVSADSGISVGFAIGDEREADDEEFEQEGLHIFVEDALVEPLDGLTLDARMDDDGTKLFFR